MTAPSPTPAHETAPAGARPPRAGFTLLETVVAVVLLATILAMAGTCLTSLLSVVGRAVDEEKTFLRAASALVRIKEELSSAVQDPKGLTIAPAYAVSASSVTFRAPEGLVAPTDPSFATLVAAGRVSLSGIVYAPYARTISYDAASQEVRLTATGTLPAGMPATEVLARDVVDFAFFDGESRTSPPSAPTNASWVLGCRLLVRRAATSPEAKGELVDSAVAGTIPTIRVVVAPETLINKRAKPATGGT